MIDLVHRRRAERALLRSSVDRVRAPLREAVARRANESDTRLFVTDLLCDGLGYDKYRDLVTEQSVGGDFCDYGLLVDGALRVLVEVKRCWTTLSPRHLNQVQAYALNAGVEWVVVTNAVRWEVHHLTAELPVSVEMVVECDTLTGEGVDALALLSPDAWRDGALHEQWRRSRSTSDTALRRALEDAGVQRAVSECVQRDTGYAPGGAWLRARLSNLV